MSERVAALLPMKGHSQRVEGKNFRLLYGRPLFRWMLDTLLRMPEIDQVIINTDARELLERNGLPRDAKIVIRDRRPEICGDDVSMNLIIADDIEAIDADIYVMTHATNPLLSADTIREALAAFKERRAAGSHDSLFAVDRVQARVYTAAGAAVNHDPALLIQTQDLEPCFVENSNLYIFTRESFRKSAARIGASPLMFETPAGESIDIDTPQDWARAALEAYALQMRADG